MEKQRKKHADLNIVDKTILGKIFQEISKVGFLENIKLHFQIIKKKKNLMYNVAKKRGRSCVYDGLPVLTEFSVMIEEFYTCAVQ